MKLESPESLFGHAKLNEAGRSKYNQVTAAFVELWTSLCANGVEFAGEGTQCLRRLQEAKMWAAKAISLNPDNQEGA